MKIAVFTDTFFPATNGIVTSVIAFSEELAKSGHEILIVTPYNKGVEAFKRENIEVFTIKGIPAVFYPDFKITFGFTPKLINKIRKFKPDVIHFHTQFITGWQAIIIGKMFNIPRVGTFHTYIADESYLKIIGLNSKIFGDVGWNYNNFFYKKIEKVVVPSHNARRELIKHGIPEKNIEIVSNPLPFFHQNEITKKIFLKKVKTENIILYVGRISKEKSINISLEAIYVVTRAIPDVMFVIVGDGPEKANLQAQAKALKIDKNVLFLGKIPHGDLINSDIFEKSKIFLSSSGSENQPMTLIEAMYFGLPIVGVDEKGVGELIKDNGFKARLDNYGELALYLIDIFRDDELRLKMSEESKRLSSDFNLEKLAHKLEKVYYKTIANFK